MSFFWGCNLPFQFWLALMYRGVLMSPLFDGMGRHELIIFIANGLFQFSLLDQSTSISIKVMVGTFAPWQLRTTSRKIYETSQNHDIRFWLAPDQADTNWCLFLGDVICHFNFDWLWCIEACWCHPFLMGWNVTNSTFSLQMVSVIDRPCICSRPSLYSFYAPSLTQFSLALVNSEAVSKTSATSCNSW